MQKEKVIMGMRRSASSGGFINRLGALFQGPLINLLIPLAFGIYLVVSTYPARDEFSRMLEKLPLLNVRTFENIAPDTRGLVTGVLANNDVDDITELVFYDRFHWLSYDKLADPENEETSASWVDSGKFFPTGFSIETDDGIIKVARNLDAEFTGHYQELVIPPQDAETRNEVDNITLNSIQAKGFGNGDQVTILGYKTDEGTFFPEEIYGGTKKEMVATYRRPALTILGIGAAVIISVVAVVVIVYIRQGKRQFISPSQM